uniref:Protein TIC 214 n=1 Tax=Utricularia amethystina TaxID=192273 RepID=A0A650DPQ6_9LAMI|nr:hypothetical chloroplast RF19 [Utricularia amethystina]
MIFQSFLLGNLVSLCMKIIHSVVVVGLYYGFLTTFSIGPSYLFLLRAQVMEEGTEKKVSATTGFIAGQFMIFISIYYAPLHLALGRPHTITVLALPYLLFQFFWKNHKHFFYSGSTTRNSMRNFSIQCVFLNNLIFQLFNHFILPSSMLTRLVKIYMFRCNNKMLFVTSSFVGWLIGHILFMKWLRLVLVCIRQNHSIRSNKDIRSNKYLVSELINSMARVFSILLFITCVYYLGRIPSPILTKKLKETPKVEERVDKERAYEKIKETKQKQEKSNILFLLYFVEKVIGSILFDSKRWNRPLRYIENHKFERAIRNEMSQYFFSIYKSGGKETISFTYPPILGIFFERLKKKICWFTFEKYSSNEFYSSWFYLNNKKLKNFHTTFINRIQALDKEYTSFSFNILETKPHLCNKDHSTNKYFSKKHDPLLNGSYRRAKSVSSSIDQKLNTSNFIKYFGINKIHRILLKDPYLHLQDFEEQKGRFDKNVFSKDIFDSLIFSKKFVTASDSIRTVRSLVSKEKSDSKYFVTADTNGKTNIIPTGTKKKIPRWLYKLISELQQQSGEQREKVSLDYEIRSRKAKRVVILTTTKEDTNPKKTNTNAVDETNEVALIRYSQQPDFRRGIIKGSMRAQRRKIVICELLQAKASSHLFLDRIQKKPIFSFTIRSLIQPIYKTRLGAKTLQNLEYIEVEEEPNDKTRIDIAEAWDTIPFAQVIRGIMLLIQSFFRKYIILPSFILAKNIGRILLFQRPEWSEDLQEWNREMYVKCTYNGIPLSETEFPKNWLTDGIQIKIVFPFCLKPWHKSNLRSIKIKNTKADFCFLTIWGMESEFPFGSARKRPDFFKPIFKELEKKKDLYKQKIIRFFSFKEIFKSSEIKVIPNKKDFNIRRSKKSKKGEIIQTINRQLIDKLYLFFKFLFEKIYTNISFYIITICKRNTELFLEETKKIIDKSISNKKKKNNPTTPVSSRRGTIVKSQTNSHISYDVSYISQVYVFLKLSQLQIKNTYKFVQQYKGIRPFLKTDSQAMIIVDWKLERQKLPSYEITQCKKWLKEHYQYDLSEMKRFRLIQKKSRNRVHQRRIIQKQNLSKKRDSYENHQLIPLKKNFKISSLSSKRDNFEKYSNYDVLAYKIINSEKESFFYRSAFQEKKNQEISSNTSKETLFEVLKNRPFLNVRGRRILYMKKGVDKKYFDWTIINFDLRQKDDIETWLMTNINIYINPQIYTNNYKKIPKKYIFFLKLPEIKRTNSQKGFFDWMGMNAENRKEALENPELWFFSEFVFLSNRYKKKPWFIPTKLLILNWNINEKKRSENKKIGEKNKVLLSSSSQKRNKEENEPKNPKDIEYVSSKKNDMEENFTRSEGKKIKQYKSKIEAELDLFLKRYLLFQLRGNNALTQKMISNIKVYCLLLKLMDPKRITLSSIQKRELALDIMLIQKNLTLKELMNKNVFIIEPIRMSVKKDGQFSMYQIVNISLVHKSKDQTTQKDQEQRYVSKSHFTEVVSPRQRITAKNSYLLVPENILSIRGCRTFRIFIYLNSTYKNYLERNTVVWNGKGVKNISQVSHENNDINTDKNPLIKLKGFFWPNYRLEDLACMNRYWFNTTNGSRFTMLRLQLYSQLKTQR